MQDSIASSIAGNAASLLIEGLHFVAGGHQRPFDDATNDAGKHFEMFHAVMLRFTEVIGNRAADGLVHAEFDGAAADTVDTQHEGRAPAPAPV